MSAAAALIDACRNLDVRLEVLDGRLRCDAPQGALDPDLRAELAAHKAEILALLAALRSRSCAGSWPTGRSHSVNAGGAAPTN
jgi:hypothetical protein